jgi:cell pole-organizing protein PopZ
MTDETNTDEEPSIEEILSSIRDIISDEDEDGEQPAEETPVAEESSAPETTEDTPVVVESAPEPVETPVAENDTDDDVLDLANFEQEQDDINIDEEIAQEVEAEDNNKESDDPLAGINLDHPEDDLDVTDAPDDDGLADILEEENIVEESVTEVVEENIQAPVPEISEPDTEPEDDALVDKIAETATVGAMAKLAENIAISNSVEGTTLEDIVRELLRPMIKTWLDDNLPNTIERLVSKELERLAEKAIRK